MFNNTKVELESLPNGDWRTLKEVIWYEKDHEIIVPKGFKTDLASIPKLLRWFVSNDDGRIRSPAIVHDWVYYNRGRVGEKLYSRQDADNLFYRTLRFLKVSKGKAKLMYYAVRLGGYFVWRG
jgi:hypothetical protein